MKAFVAGFVCLVAQLCVIGQVASAQGVVCQLPEDGTWVRFEGTYAQSEIRPDTPDGKLDINPWIEHVWIKSVGAESAEYRGESTPCRWIEIKIERGREIEVTDTQLGQAILRPGELRDVGFDTAGGPVTEQRG